MIKLLLTVLQALAGLAVLSRLAGGALRTPAPTVQAGKPVGTVSVVIPARNEATRITPCLEGLRDQPVSEVLVIDDHSTDSTALMAEALGAIVKPAPALPHGWVGKPWALDVGLRAATSEWVLFLDADVRPQPGLVEAIVQRASSTGEHVVSLSARFLTRSPLQQALHASFLAGLVYRFGAVDSRITSSVQRTIMNGQCVLVRREWLISQGGFALAKSNMTDDIALAQALAARGARIGFADGSKLLDVAMYESATETWHEWGRSLPMADVLPRRVQVLDLATLALTQALPVMRLLTGRSTILDRALLGMRVALQLPLRQTFAQPGAATWISFLADPVAVTRLAIALVKPSRSWRGRTYDSAGTSIR